jgi:hypothetical protein
VRAGQPKLSHIASDDSYGGRVAFYEQHVRSSARQRLEAHGTGAGEEICEARSGQ